MQNAITVPIEQDNDVVMARAAGRKMAKDLDFSSADQTRLATAISELARNILRYAGNGKCTIFGKSDNQTASVTVVVEDKGPGIPSLEAAMEDGFTTGGGLGAGLPGTRRLVHQFDIHSEPGNTRITIAMHRSAAQQNRTRSRSGLSTQPIVLAGSP